MRWDVRVSYACLLLYREYNCKELHYREMVKTFNIRQYQKYSIIIFNMETIQQVLQLTRSLVVSNAEISKQY